MEDFLLSEAKLFFYNGLERSGVEATKLSEIIAELALEICDRPFSCDLPSPVELDGQVEDVLDHVEWIACREVNRMECDLRDGDFYISTCVIVHFNRARESEVASRCEDAH